MRRHEQILLLQTLVQKYRIRDLNQFGFGVDENSVRQAQNRAKIKEYQPYVKPIPPSSTKYHSEDFAVLFQWIDLHTSETCEVQILKPRPTFRTCEESFKQPRLAQNQILDEKYNPNLAREWMWEKRVYRGTKRALFKEFKRDHGESRFSESAFRRATKRLGRAKRRTDTCNRCDRLEYVGKVKTQMIGAHQPIPEELLEEERILQLHRQHAQIQRTYVEDAIEACQAGELVVRIDFKENWKMSIREDQGRKDFYKFQQLTHLGCCVCSVRGGNKQLDFTHYISEVLNHDAFFVVSALTSLLSTQPCRDASKTTFVFDTGPHFRNKTVLYFLLHHLTETHPTLIRHVVFYHEGHGKSRVDSSFGFNGLKFYLNFRTTPDGIAAAPLANVSPDKYQKIAVSIVETKRTKPLKTYGQIVPPFTVATQPQSLNVTIDRENGEKQKHQNRRATEKEETDSSNSDTNQFDNDLPKKTKRTHSTKTPKQKKSEWWNRLVKNHPEEGRRKKKRRDSGDDESESEDEGTSSNSLYDSPSIQDD
ncbi:hypothetical protein BLNAU_8195 [Blattamonas nauphoetae]|uniref:Uncharacterized protein n=1 Tax=Blattamonas nauphoetae TaxID=2049346 RepID=A0ABQ9XZL5_9EUKA|nr:hypothetical protein BLNAU_8195 [Blattamonas nauphoetae]